MELYTIHLAGRELSPNSINISELDKMRFPVFKLLTAKTVPTHGTPSPQKAKKKMIEHSSFFISALY